MSLDKKDAGNAVFLGDRRIGISGRKYKLCKTDGQIRKFFIGSKSLINAIFSGGYNAFVFSYKKGLIGKNYKIYNIIIFYI